MVVQSPTGCHHSPLTYQSGPISTAQLATNYNDILYASVRTVAKISNVAGTTNAFIFYSNDTQEIDFAFLTSDISKAWLTNEQNSNTSPYSTYSVAAPADANTAWHEYRLDWLPGVSKFFIDGVLVQTITDNVPTAPGSWIWNNWSKRTFITFCAKQHAKSTFRQWKFMGSGTSYR